MVSSGPRVLYQKSAFGIDVFYVCIRIRFVVFFLHFDGNKKVRFITRELSPKIFAST